MISKGRYMFTSLKKSSGHAHESCCQFCESNTVKRVSLKQEFQYGVGEQQVTLLATVPVWTCQECGEQYEDDDAEIIRHDVVCRHLGRLTPTELRKIRRNAGYSQAGWAELTGIGVASIKRWESLNQIQGAASDRYLRLISDSRIVEKLRLQRKVQTEMKFNKAVFRTRITE